MRIACIHFPHFLFQIERLKKPDIDGQEVIIATSPSGKDKVADCSDEAAAQGITPDMTVREAYFRCPDAIMLPFSNRYTSAWENILFAIGEFTMRIEAPTLGLAYLDVTKAKAIYPDEHALALAIIQHMKDSFHLDVRVGMGNSRFIAAQAALCAWGTLVIHPGGEKDFLSLVSMEALPLKEEEKAHLRMLGLNTLKRMVHLSRRDFCSQLGAKGSAIFDMVNGQDDTQLIPKRSGRLYLEREFVSDMPLHTSEEIRPAADDMIRALSSELKKMHLVSRKAAVMLTFQNGRCFEKQLIMKELSAESSHLALRVNDFIDHLVIENPIASFRIAIVDPVSAESEQGDLFRKKSLFTDRLEGIKDYFSALYGFAPLMRIEEGDSQSQLPERRFKFADA
jgi:DNA polymerase IV